MQILGFTLCSVCVWERELEIKGVRIVYNKSKYFKRKTKKKSVISLQCLSLSLHCSSNFVRVSWQCSTWRQTILLSSSPGHLALLFWSYSTSHKGKVVFWSKSLTTPPTQYSGAHIDCQAEICTRCAGQECVAMFVMRLLEIA